MFQCHDARHGVLVAPACDMRLQYMTIEAQGIVLKGGLGFAAGREMIPERTCMLKAAGKRDFAAALRHSDDADAAENECCWQMFWRL